MLRQLLGGSLSLAPLAPRTAAPVPPEVAYDANLSGQVFVFTGFRDEVLAARIGNAGGTVAGGISRKVRQRGGRLGDPGRPNPEAGLDRAHVDALADAHEAARVREARQCLVDRRGTLSTKLAKPAV